MAGKKKILGMERVIQRLHAEVVKIEGRTLAGLIEFAILIRRDMDYTPPLIPVGDTGNLRHSWFVVTARKNEHRGQGSFTGKNASQLAADHGSVQEEAKGIARSFKYPVLIMGFSANYATFVHEMVGGGEKRISWNRPGSGSKFLQASIRRNMKEGLGLIAKNARIR